MQRGEEIRSGKRKRGYSFEVFFSFVKDKFSNDLYVALFYETMHFLLALPFIKARPWKREREKKRKTNTRKENFINKNRKQSGMFSENNHGPYSVSLAFFLSFCFVYFCVVKKWVFSLKKIFSQQVMWKWIFSTLFWHFILTFCLFFVERKFIRPKWMFAEYVLFILKSHFSLATSSGLQWF